MKRVESLWVLASRSPAPPAGPLAEAAFVGALASELDFAAVAGDRSTLLGPPSGPLTLLDGADGADPPPRKVLISRSSGRSKTFEATTPTTAPRTIFVITCIAIIQNSFFNSGCLRLRYALLFGDLLVDHNNRRNNQKNRENRVLHYKLHHMNIRLYSVISESNFSNYPIRSSIIEHSETFDVTSKYIP